MYQAIIATSAISFNISFMLMLMTISMSKAYSYCLDVAFEKVVLILLFLTLNAYK